MVVFFVCVSLSFSYILLISPNLLLISLNLLLISLSALLILLILLMTIGNVEWFVEFVSEFLLKWW